jgi:hypothetical protein
LMKHWMLCELAQGSSVILCRKRRFPQVSG